MAKKKTNEKIAIIGLGYVGLPLAILLAEHFEHVVGYDIDAERIRTLKAGTDVTKEIEDEQIAASSLVVTDDVSQIDSATFYIVTVPTPTLPDRTPDLRPLEAACRTIGPRLNKGDVVVFESTVYPGVTQEICGPILAAECGLEQSVDFFLGYSPERINPGDKANTVDKIHKIVAGDSPATLARVSDVYGPAITAGIFRVESIKVAECAKVLENTQRDVNIALMNEVSLICDKIGISTRAVIEAAATKWNFMPFTPGLVGGHCIGVDPYYLASLAERVGHHPEVILAGRRLNDRMASHVATEVLKKLALRGTSIRNARVGVFGLTFKENVPDTRNSKSIDLVRALNSYGCNVLVNDPHVSAETATEYGLSLATLDEMVNLEVIVLAVAHREYVNDPAFLDRLIPGGNLIDVRSAYYKKPIRDDILYWSL